MPIIQVFIEVKAGQVAPFRDATVANVRESRKESGVIRFDFFQQEDVPTKFILIEIYKDTEAHEAHRATTHYLTWRDTVADMMAEQRYSLRYVDLFPSS